MKILITGSNGFVGSRLMWFLEEKGFETVGIDRNPVCKIEKHPNTKIGDLNDYKVFEGIEAVDMIIHASAAKHDFGITDKEYYDDNVVVTQNVIKFAIAQKCKSLIYYSTVAIFGSKKTPCDENGEIAPNHVYGHTKLEGEILCKNWANEDATRSLLVLRPTIIYGPHNLANMYNLIHYRYRFPWFMIGDGNHKKSMVSLANLIDMHWFGQQRMKPGTLIYNCIDKPDVTVNELNNIIATVPPFKNPSIKISTKIVALLALPFDWLGRITGFDFPLNTDRVNKYSTETVFLANKIRDDGYVQQHSIADEIVRTVKWYLQKRK